MPYALLCKISYGTFFDLFSDWFIGLQYYQREHQRSVTTSSLAAKLWLKVIQAQRRLISKGHFGNRHNYSVVLITFRFDNILLSNLAIPCTDASNPLFCKLQLFRTWSTYTPLSVIIFPEKIFPLRYK